MLAALVIAVIGPNASTLALCQGRCFAPRAPVVSPHHHHCSEMSSMPSVAAAGACHAIDARLAPGQVQAVFSVTFPVAGPAPRASLDAASPRDARISMLARPPGPPRTLALPAVLRIWTASNSYAGSSSASGTSWRLASLSATDVP